MLGPYKILTDSGRRGNLGHLRRSIDWKLSRRRVLKHRFPAQVLSRRVEDNELLCTHLPLAPDQQVCFQTSGTCQLTDQPIENVPQHSVSTYRMLRVDKPVHEKMPMKDSTR